MFFFLFFLKFSPRKLGEDDEPNLTSHIFSDGLVKNHQPAVNQFDKVEVKRRVKHLGSRNYLRSEVLVQKF